jgi:hypothetical protein
MYLTRNPPWTLTLTHVELSVLIKLLEKKNALTRDEERVAKKLHTIMKNQSFLKNPKFAQKTTEQLGIDGGAEET